MGRRASPRCWHVVKKHARRLVCAPPSFIVSADTPRSPRGFLLFLAGGGVGSGSGASLPRFSPLGPWGARLAEPRRLCLKVGLLGSRSLPAGPGTSSPGMGRLHHQRKATLDPRSPPGVCPFGKLDFRIPSLYKFSHDVSGARGRVRTAGKRRAVRMSSSVTCKE